MQWLTPISVVGVVMGLAYAFALILYPEPPSDTSVDSTRYNFGDRKRPAFFKPRSFGIGILGLLAFVLVLGWLYHQ